MISNDKKKLLHVAAQKLGLSDPEYRHVLIEHTGFLSCADEKFTDDDFKKVLDHFKALGFWVKRKFEQDKPRDFSDLPTPAQLKVIDHLWRDLSEYIGGARSTAFRQGFYRERLRIHALGPQTRAQANAVIEALKNRVHSEMRKAVNKVGIGAKEEG